MVKCEEREFHWYKCPKLWCELIYEDLDTKGPTPYGVQLSSSRRFILIVAGRVRGNVGWSMGTLAIEVDTSGEMVLYA